MVITAIADQYLFVWERRRVRERARSHWMRDGVKPKKRGQGTLSFPWVLLPTYGQPGCNDGSAPNCFKDSWFSKCIGRNVPEGTLGVSSIFAKSWVSQDSSVRSCYSIVSLTREPSIIMHFQTPTWKDEMGCREVPRPRISEDFLHLLVHTQILTVP